MKNRSGRTFFHCNLFVCAALALFLQFTACQKDSTADESIGNVAGTWHQISQTKDGIAVAKDSSRLLLQINKNQICVLCDSSFAAVKAKAIVSRSGWSYTEGLLNIAIDLPASWTPIVDSNSLSLQRVDFNSDGTLSKTILKFERVGDFEIK